MSRITRPVQDLISNPRIVDGRAGGEIDPRFSAWLQVKLHKIYDDITAEPLPEDLKTLVYQLDEPRPRR